jgi:hypothetical protein
VESRREKGRVLISHWSACLQLGLTTPDDSSPRPLAPPEPQSLGSSDLTPRESIRFDCSDNIEPRLSISVYNCLPRLSGGPVPINISLNVREPKEILATKDVFRLPLRLIPIPAAPRHFLLPFSLSLSGLSLPGNAKLISRSFIGMNARPLNACPHLPFLHLNINRLFPIASDDWHSISPLLTTA